MLPVSSDFLDALLESHVIEMYVDVVGPNGDTIRVRPLDGYVTVDRTATIRRSVTLTFLDPTGSLLPDDPGDLLTPYGTVLKPYRGIKYTSGPKNGQTEVVPLGIFRLSSVTISEDGDGQGGGSVGGKPGLIIQLDGYDMSRMIQRDKFTAPYILPKGMNIITAIKRLVSRTLDALDYDTDFNTTSTTVVTAAGTYDVGNDPWTSITTLATSIGCDAYFDAQGTFVIAPPTDPDSMSEPVFSYIEGNNSGYLAIQRIFSDDPGYNGVVVTGETIGNSKTPVRAVVWDTNPSSVTYHLGPYGEVPMFIADQNIATVAAATTAARAQLNKVIGFTSQVTLGTLVNPAYEAGDVIRVVRSKLNVNDRYGIDAFNIPFLASETQTVTLRQKRISI